MKVLVLGGGGFIGTHISSRLINGGEDVRVFGRHFLDRSAFGGAEIIQGDFNDETVLTTALQGVDVVLHLVHATFPTVANLEMVADLERSVIGTVRLLQAAHSQGVKRLVFFSSGGTVYGPASISPIDEDHPTHPIGAYGINKLTIEKYVSLFEHMHGMQGYVLRISNPFGPLQFGLTQQGLIPNVYRRVAGNLSVPVYGDGTSIRDYTYVENVVDAVRCVLSYHGSHRCFNVGSADHGRTVKQVIEAVEQAMGKRAVLEHLPARSFDVPSNVLSCERLKRETGWKPEVNFEDGIRRTIKWLEARTAV